MTFQEFVKRKEQLEKDGIFISIPQYYDLIPDDMVLTPEHIAVIMERNVKRVRMWFSEGLKQGPLISLEPTRHKVLGIHLKEWLFAGDFKKIVTNNPAFFI